MSTAVRTSTRRPETIQTMQAGDGLPQAGRLWHLQQEGKEVGSFTDLRRRNFFPGERLIDDQGHRRVVIAVLDAANLRLGVSAALP